MNPHQEARGLMASVKESTSATWVPPKVTSPRLFNVFSNLGIDSISMFSPLESREPSESGGQAAAVAKPAAAPSLLAGSRWEFVEEAAGNNRELDDSELLASRLNSLLMSPRRQSMPNLFGSTNGGGSSLLRRDPLDRPVFESAREYPIFESSHRQLQPPHSQHQSLMPQPLQQNEFGHGLAPSLLPPPLQHQQPLPHQTHPLSLGPTSQQQLMTSTGPHQHPSAHHQAAAANHPYRGMGMGGRGGMSRMQQQQPQVPHQHQQQPHLHHPQQPLHLGSTRGPAPSHHRFNPAAAEFSMDSAGTRSAPNTSPRWNARMRPQHQGFRHPSDGAIGFWEAPEIPLGPDDEKTMDSGVAIGYDAFETGADERYYTLQEDGGMDMGAALGPHRRTGSMDHIHPGVLPSVGSSAGGYAPMRGHHRRMTTPDQIHFDRASYVHPASETMSTTHFDEELPSPELSPRVSIPGHSRRPSMASIKSSDDRSSRQRHSVFCSDALQQLMDAFGFNLSGVPVGLATKGSDRHNFNRPFVIDKKDLYKTEICRNWKSKGSCRYGNACHYAHGEADIRARQRIDTFKTLPCVDPAAIGQDDCQYGERCNYAHPGESIRKIHTEDKGRTYFDSVYQDGLKAMYGQHESPFGVAI